MITIRKKRGWSHFFPSVIFQTSFCGRRVVISESIQLNATNEPSRTARFARVFLPWLLAGAMFAVYLFTLDHWISPDSLRHVVHLTDPDWTPEISGPVTALVMFPLRWLPAARIPLAANLFLGHLRGVDTRKFLARFGHVAAAHAGVGRPLAGPG